MTALLNVITESFAVLMITSLTVINSVNYVTKNDIIIHLCYVAITGQDLKALN